MSTVGSASRRATAASTKLPVASADCSPSRPDASSGKAAVSEVITMMKKTAAAMEPIVHRRSARSDARETARRSSPKIA